MKKIIFLDLKNKQLLKLSLILILMIFNFCLFNIKRCLVHTKNDMQASVCAYFHCCLMYDLAHTAVHTLITDY